MHGSICVAHDEALAGRGRFACGSFALAGFPSSVYLVVAGTHCCRLRGSCKWLWGQTRAGGRACGSGSGRRMAVGSAGPCRKTTEHVGGTKGVKCRQRARENVTGIDQKVTASLCCGKVSCSFCCLTGSSGLGAWGRFGCERLVTCSHRHARPWPRMGVYAARAP